jgi:hypothetical protein
MLDAHELMFGDAGRQCATLVLKWAWCLFAVPLNPLNIRVVLAPVELGPYNRHTGYHQGDGQDAFILANRHIVQWHDSVLVLADTAEDFIVHELTHSRQHQLMCEHGWTMKRGAHRDPAWFTAVSEACPKYLGFELPSSLWPTGPRTRPGTLTEVEMTHWPESLRSIAGQKDPRLANRTPTRVHGAKIPQDAERVS